MIKRIVRIVLLALAAVLIYLIVGATAPFWKLKTVSEPEALRIDRETLAEEYGTADRVMLLETSGQAWEERLRLLNQAQERIVLSTFDIRDGESTRDILAVILQKADEGVSVKMFVDGFSGQAHMGSQPLFLLMASHPNIEIRWYNPVNLLTPWTSMGRMHDKYLLVDDLAYILGGRNTFDYFVGDYPSEYKSYDREVLVYNPEWETGTAHSSIPQLEAYFEEIWNLEVCQVYRDDEDLAGKTAVKKERENLEARYAALREARPDLWETTGEITGEAAGEAGVWADRVSASYTERTKPAQAIRLLANPTTIYGKEPTIFYQLTELMKQAGERVLIHTPYAVCSDAMYEALRGVAEAVPDTRLVINSVENGDNFVASSDYLRNKPELAATGVDLYEYDGGLSYHGKTVVVDGDLSIIGSFNFDMRSAYLDTELMLLIQSEELTGELTGYMEGIQADCRRVVNAEEYETPAHITVAEIPLWKRAAMAVFGFVLQPFRYLA